MVRLEQKIEEWRKLTCRQLAELYSSDINNLTQKEKEAIKKIYQKKECELHTST